MHGAGAAAPLELPVARINAVGIDVGEPPYRTRTLFARVSGAGTTNVVLATQRGALFAADAEDAPSRNEDGAAAKEHSQLLAVMTGTQWLVKAGANLCWVLRSMGGAPQFLLPDCAPCASQDA